ncbi:MAG: replication initiation factor family protein [Circular genetic element sp.]|nr:MAG: replication initiation factor family protein [Circular genetic element sp.]
MTCSQSDRVFCDWLDVTFAPHDTPYPEVNRLLLDAGFDVESPDRTAFSYRHPDHPSSLLLVAPSRGTMRFSASGSACGALRDLGLWHDYLSALSSSPHRVTRVDAALDLPMDGADLVQLMRDRYPSGEVNLSRKSVRTTTFLEVRPDGRESGTWYAGHKSKARYTARVYDKALEALSKRGQLLPPTARIEVTAKGGDSGATLRDAAMPAALFWSIASPALLTAPEDAPVWTPNHDLGWTAEPREFDPAMVLRRRVEGMALLDALALVADDLGPNGRAYLLNLISKRLEASPALADEAAA